MLPSPLLSKCLYSPGISASLKAVWCSFPHSSTPFCSSASRLGASELDRMRSASSCIVALTLVRQAAAVVSVHLREHLVQCIEAISVGHDTNELLESLRSRRHPATSWRSPCYHTTPWLAPGNGDCAHHSPSCRTVLGSVTLLLLLPSLHGNLRYKTHHSRFFCWRLGGGSW